MSNAWILALKSSSPLRFTRAARFRQMQTAKFATGKGMQMAWSALALGNLIQFMNTTEQLRRAIAIARERELAKLKSSPLVRRVDAKRGKLVARKLRAKSSQSMLDMGQLARHQPLPRFPDERTKQLFTAYEKRKWTPPTHSPSYKRNTTSSAN